MSLKDRLIATRDNPAQYVELINPIIEEGRNCQFGEFVALALDDQEGEIKAQFTQPLPNEATQHLAGQLAAVLNLRQLLTQDRVVPQYGE